jgi:hypothetical protein
MQATGEDLLAQAFEQVTDEQVVAFSLKTNKLRMDSTQIASNIRQYSRLQLLVEVLQRQHRDLSKADQQTYASEFAAYLKGSSGQYVYRVKPEAYASHLEQVGQLMQQLVLELAAAYATQPSYQMLVRVFNEHFIIEEKDDDDDDDGPKAGLRPRQGDELRATSLQSPDDGVASYRQKRGEDFTGYVANLAETCHPENPFQLIMDLQSEPNTTDDAAMLAESLPKLKERTDVDQMHTDGGYNSPEVDQVMRQYQVEQVQTAIRGRQANPAKLNLDDFVWTFDPQGQPLALTAPPGHWAKVEPGRQPDRYIARFDLLSPTSSSSPVSTAPATKPAPPPVLYFSQQQLDLALRRQRSVQARTEGSNLRVAIEATVGALKRPFNNDQLPVRGPFRVKMVLVGSAFMVNLRRIHRYQTAKNHQKGQGDSSTRSFSLPFGHQIRTLVDHLTFVLRFSPVHC